MSLDDPIKRAVLPCGCEAIVDVEDPPQLQSQYGLYDLYLEYTYLPQVTSGPWGPVWNSNGDILAFSMKGSIWIITIGSDSASQLTFPISSYDSQPVWSPIGKSIVFVRDTGKSIDLWEIDLINKNERQLTHFNQVSIHPRWHSDGMSVLYCSNFESDYFHLRLFNLSTSEDICIYKSPNSHAIAPDWSADGSKIIFQSNVALSGSRSYGAGYLYSLELSQQKITKLLVKEELFHYAQPRWCPTSNKVIFVGQNEGHAQLRLVDTSTGYTAQALVENISNVFTPDWSADGTKLAFVDFDGSTSHIHIHNVYSGELNTVKISKFTHCVQYAVLKVNIVDSATNEPCAARIYCIGSDNKFYSPEGSPHRQSQAVGEHYSYALGEVSFLIPLGQTEISIYRGFETTPVTVSMLVRKENNPTLNIKLERKRDMSGLGWWSGDNHCHLTYGGTLPGALGRIDKELSAEDLRVTNFLVANRDNTILDGEVFSNQPTTVNSGQTLIAFGQEFRPLWSGHLSLLGLNRLIQPAYTGYPGTPFASNYPSNATVLDWISSVGGYGGYGHPFYLSSKDPEEYGYQGAREFPIDVALGKVHFYDLACIWSYEGATASVWYKLLNLGFHIAASAGTDCFLDFWRTPAAGGTRVYVHCGSFSYTAWLNALVKGRSFVTNAPLILWSANSKVSGDELEVKPGSQINIEYDIWSTVPFNRIELLCNGKVEWSMDTEQPKYETSGKETITIYSDGWIALRVLGPSYQKFLMDREVFAHTNPIYIKTGCTSSSISEDADYFIRWCDFGINKIDSELFFDTSKQKSEVMNDWIQARNVFISLR